MSSGARVEVAFIPSDGDVPLTVQLPAGWTFHDLEGGEGDETLMKQMQFNAEHTGQGTAEDWLMLTKIKSHAQGIALGPSESALVFRRNDASTECSSSAYEPPQGWDDLGCKQHQGPLDATVWKAHATSPSDYIVFIDFGSTRLALDGQSPGVLEDATAAILTGTSHVSAD